MSWSFAGMIGVALLVAVGVLSWIFGQRRVDFVRVHTEIEIAASKEVVWGVLADFRQYPDWNPLMIEVHGPLEAQGRMDWKSRLGGVIRDYNAQIDRVVQYQELSWTGPISSLGRVIFWGEHRFIIEALENGRVRLINKERFGGLLTLPLARFLQHDVRTAYEGANLALKQRAESLQSASSPRGF